jgi:hypothetical protein
MTLNKGDRIEFPVHYDIWMQGARYGVVTACRNGKPGMSDYVYVKPDLAPHRRVKVWRLDWAYCKRLSYLV